MALRAPKGSSRQFRGGTRRRRTGPTHPLRDHLGPLALVVALLVMTGSTCRREPDSVAAPASSATVSTTQPPQTTTIPATTTTREVTPEDEVRQTLATYWSEWLLARNPPDPERPSFLALVTGRQHDRDVATLRESQALRKATRLPPNPRYQHQIRRVTIKDQEASVWDCVIDDLIVFSTADGSIIDDKLVTVLFEIQLTKASGAWQVTERYSLDRQEGAQTCPAIG